MSVCDRRFSLLVNLLRLNVWHFFACCVSWLSNDRMRKQNVRSWWQVQEHFHFGFELCFFDCCDDVINSKVQAHWRHKICMNGIFYMIMNNNRTLAFVASCAYIYTWLFFGFVWLCLVWFGLVFDIRTNQEDVKMWLQWHMIQTHIHICMYKIYPYLNESIQKILWHSCITATAWFWFHIWYETSDTTSRQNILATTPTTTNNNNNNKNNHTNLRCVSVM